MTEEGFSVGRQQVSLSRQIKNLGLHDVRIVLHPEVSATVAINVARSAEEAEQQAAGVNVLLRDDDDETADEEWFEDDADAEDLKAEGDE